MKKNAKCGDITLERNPHRYDEAPYNWSGARGRVYKMLGQSTSDYLGENVAREDAESNQ